MQDQQQIGDGVGGEGTHCCRNPLHGACGFVFRPNAQNGCHVLERNTALFVREYLQYAIVTPLTIFSRPGTAIARSVSALAMQGLCSKVDDVRSYGQLVGAGTSTSGPLEPDLSVLSAPGRKRSPKTCSYESVRKTKSKSITDA